MTAKIYTYTDISELSSCSFYPMLCESPQIFTSSGVKSACLRRFSDWREDLCLGFDELMGHLAPLWGTDEARIFAMVNLTAFLREKMDETGDEAEKRHVQSFRKNAYYLYSAITLLMEAGLSPEDLPEEGRNTLLMKEAWSVFLLTEPALDFASAMRRIQDPSFCRDFFCGALFPFSSSPRVVVHGFYYFTPLQQQILSALSKAGFELTFVFSYDRACPHANEIWRDSYRPEKGYPPLSAWQMEGRPAGNLFGSVMEGQTVDGVCGDTDLTYGHSEESDLALRQSAGFAWSEGRPAGRGGKLRLIEYGSQVHFAHDMKRAGREGFSLFSAASAEANEILRDYDPEAYGDLSLFSDPIGQFLTALHRCWDDEKGQIVLDSENLRACFASGWLNDPDHGLSGNTYLRELESLLPAFRDCRTPGEWKERAGFLREACRKAVSAFDEASGNGEGKDRWKSALGNPLLCFGVFAAGRETGGEDSLEKISQIPEIQEIKGIKRQGRNHVRRDGTDAVISLIICLTEILNILFSGSSMTSIGEYLDLLSKILRDLSMGSKWEQKQLEAAGRLFRSLKTSAIAPVPLRATDLAMAFRLLAQGILGEEDSARKRLVRGLESLEAVHIEGKEKLHICLSGLSELPGKSRGYAWPLTGTMMERCREKLTGEKRVLVEALEELLRARPKANRFFLYQAFQNRTLEISWIRERSGKISPPSPYVMMLMRRAGVKIEGQRQHMISFRDPADLGAGIEAGIGTGTEAVKPFELDLWGKRFLPKEAKMAYALCPSRYLLGYVLSPYPFFREIFLQNYALGGLITALCQRMEAENPDRIAKEVLQLFPALRRAERRQILDYLLIRDEGNEISHGQSTAYGGREYTEERLRVLFPDRGLLSSALSAYGNLGQRKSGPVDLESPPAQKKVCVFCPHQGICRNALYAVDDCGEAENYYE